MSRGLLLSCVLLPAACGSGGGAAPPADAGVTPDARADADLGPPPDLVLDLDTVHVTGAVAPAPGTTIWCSQGGELTFLGGDQDWGVLRVPDCGAGRAAFDAVVPRGVSSARWLSYLPDQRVEGPVEPFAALDSDRSDLTLLFRHAGTPLMFHRVRGTLTLAGAPFPLDCNAPAIQLLTPEGPATVSCVGGVASFEVLLSTGTHRFSLGNRGQFPDAPPGWWLDPPLVVQGDLSGVVLDVVLWPVSGDVVETGGGTICTGIPGPGVGLTGAQIASGGASVDCSSGGGLRFAARLPPGRYDSALFSAGLQLPGPSFDVAGPTTGVHFDVRWIRLAVELSGTPPPGPCDVVMRGAAAEQVDARIRGDCSTGSFVRQIMARTFHQIDLEGPDWNLALADTTAVPDATTLRFRVDTVPLTATITGVDIDPALTCSNGSGPPYGWDLQLTDAARRARRRFSLPCAPQLPAPFTVPVPLGSYRVELLLPGRSQVVVPDVIDATSGPVTWSHTLTWRQSVRIWARQNGVLLERPCSQLPPLTLYRDGVDPMRGTVGANQFPCQGDELTPLVYRIPSIVTGDYHAKILLPTPGGNGFSAFSRGLAITPR